MVSENILLVAQLVGIMSMKVCVKSFCILKKEQVTGGEIVMIQFIKIVLMGIISLNTPAGQ